MEKVLFQLMKTGMLPVKKSDGAACYDCYAKGSQNDSYTIKSGETAVIPLGFKMAIPEGYYAEIRPRSGLTRNGILVQIGTIDSDYRGEVGAITTNLSNCNYEVFGGDRICQIMIKKIVELPFEVTDKLDETKRGEGGFGSTGK